MLFESAAQEPWADGTEIGVEQKSCEIAMSGICAIPVSWDSSVLLLRGRYFIWLAHVMDCQNRKSFDTKARLHGTPSDETTTPSPLSTANPARVAGEVASRRHGVCNMWYLLYLPLAGVSAVLASRWALRVPSNMETPAVYSHMLVSA